MSSSKRSGVSRQTTNTIVSGSKMPSLPPLSTTDIVSSIDVDECKKPGVTGHSAKKLFSTTSADSLSSTSHLERPLTAGSREPETLPLKVNNFISKEGRSGKTTLAAPADLQESDIFVSSIPPPIQATQHRRSVHQFIAQETPTLSIAQEGDGAAEKKEEAKGSGNNAGVKLTP